MIHKKKPTSTASTPATPSTPKTPAKPKKPKAAKSGGGASKGKKPKKGKTPKTATTKPSGHTGKTGKAGKKGKGGKAKPSTKGSPSKAHKGNTTHKHGSTSHTPMHYVGLAKHPNFLKNATPVHYGKTKKPKHPNFLPGATRVHYGKTPKSHHVGPNVTKVQMAPTQRAKAVPGVPGYGYVPDDPDERDHQYHVLATPPAFVDLEHADGMPPVWDQGELGSCTAHGSLAGHIFAAYKSGTALPELSRLEVYYNARALEGTTSQDAGAQVRDAIKACAKGVAPETEWMYDVSKFAVRPPAKVVADSTNHAIEYLSVPAWAGASQASLSEGFPVVVGLTLYESFESDQALSSGVVPWPSRGENILGGHCMLEVGIGYGHEWIAAGQFPDALPDVHYSKMRNSWGTDVYQAGYLLIPSAYLHRHGQDFWTIRTAN